MSAEMTGPRAIISLTSLVVFAAALSDSGTSGSYRQFETLRGKAMAADRAGRWQDAKPLWEQAHAIAPDADQPLLQLAAVAARLGLTDEAFAWLAEAYDGSLFDPASFEVDQDYALLHDDPRWNVLLARLKTEFDDGSARSRQRQTDLDPQSAASFKSYRKLAATFTRRRKELDDDRWHLAYADYNAKTFAIRDQRVAALHRYLEEHPTAGDRADAAWDVIETRVSSRYIYNLYYRWGEFGTQILEELDAFVSEYPGSRHNGRASLVRAFVEFGVRPESGTGEIPWRHEDMRALDRALAETHRNYAGTTPGGMALAWRLVLADDPSSKMSVPELRAMADSLRTDYRFNREVREFWWYSGATADVLISGVDGFEGTDLGGTRWTASAFKGKVTLIGFWATWCGPCVGEIPTVRKAWNAYHDKGFEVLGVSLDFDDRAQFEGWLARNDVAWPQIWDGKGFSTPLAKRYNVHKIPFTVLVDRDGHVTNVNLHGDALLARIAALLEVSGEAEPDARSN